MRPRYGISALSAFVLLSACADNDDQQNEQADNQENTQENNEEDVDVQAQEAAVQDLYFYMDESDVDALYTRSPNSDDRLGAEVKLDPDSDEVLELDGGMRFRGNTARGLEKKSFNVRFEEDQPFLTDHNRMNLNGMFRDPSMMREKISWDIFEDAGMVSPSAEYFDFYLNDIYEGLYVHIDRIDMNLMERFDRNPNGTLVRDQIRGREGEQFNVNSTFGFDMSQIDQADQVDFLEETFNYRGDPNWGEVREFIDLVQRTPAGPEFAQMMEEETETESFLTWLALHMMVGDIDAFGDDYWLYLDHEDPDAGWEIIPWDKNLSFGSHTRQGYGVLNDFFGYEYEMDPAGWDNQLFEKLMETDELRDDLEERLVELMEQFPPSYVEERASEYQEQIEESVETRPGEDAFERHPQNHFGELDDYELRAEQVTQFVPLRYEYLRTQLGLNEAQQEQAAQADVSAGETVYLTDSAGFVIGSFEADQGEGSLSVETEDADIPGIQQEYRLTADNTLSGELSLFYKNDLGWPIEGNWYEEDEAVGSQGELVLFQDGSMLESEVNPYVNRIQGDVELDGTSTFTITYP
ncbi:CotH kinase family protein [Alkalicoccus chagannorensis]|uniref:CotH kinase family protein n=1 Tax=Alkalicoccus chagannorensis TaxID=427072 RepID=UPI001476DCB1|nr:CotH kinase family protein [Alkalicoccus chagannorensis]